MAAGPGIDVSGWAKGAKGPRPARICSRVMVATFAEALMGAEGNAVRGGGFV